MLKEYLLKTNELFERAKKGDVFVLDNLHTMEIRSKTGKTILHYLARAGKIEILKHPLVNKVRNNKNKTPKDILIDEYGLHVVDEYIINKYKNI